MREHGSELVDPYYNSQYRRIHEKRKYGDSGIEFLPEAVLYFLNGVATGHIRIEKDRPVTIIDYGCGQSAMGKGLEVVLSPVVAAVQSGEVVEADIYGLYSLTANNLCDVMKNTYFLSHMPPSCFGTIEVTRYDPAIQKYSATPEGPYDYVVCTDVVEHLPEKKRDEYKKTVLRANIEKIDALSNALYINASCRDAVNALPNGSSAHCTIKSALEWKTCFSNNFVASLSPVLSRDLTSCSFTKGKVLPLTKDLAYKFIDLFGAIDLIPYPPQEDMPSIEKLQRLSFLQNSKQQVIADNILYWKQCDPTASTRPEFGRLVEALQKTM
ncbi:MAG: hypothetical protein WC464_04840 [Bdellovibrionales bacterium]